METLYKNMQSHLVIIPCTPTIVVRAQAYSPNTQSVSWYIADIPKYILNHEWPRHYIQDSVVIEMYEKKGKDKASHKIAWQLMSVYRQNPRSVVVYINRVWIPDICEAFEDKRFEQFILHEVSEYPEVPTLKRYLRMVAFKNEDTFVIETIKPDFVILQKASLS